MILTSCDALKGASERARGRIQPANAMITVGLGTCGLGNGAQQVFETLGRQLKGRADVTLKRVGCFGFCAQEPLVMLYLPQRPVLLFKSFQAKDVDRFLEVLDSPQTDGKLLKRAFARIETWDFKTSRFEFGRGFASVPLWHELPFFQGQHKVVLRDCGFVDPEAIEDYLAVGGYQALAKALHEHRPQDVIEIVTSAKLRGRGGAGFPTGKKWALMRQQQSAEKYVICNADEGDPGAYMNRNEIESDPHMLLEGLAIGAYAMGARNGIVYLRAQYPLAVERLSKAIQDARDWGLLGEGILGSDFSFDVELVRGAGAFVCGEETALIASIEGQAGRPTPRPPFPAQKGLYGFPTDINNVETWCNVPVILAQGAEKFRGVGTGASPGTKVFSLVGKIKNKGLVELPLGTEIDTIVYGMGEGTGSRKRIRAIQTGGPSGGCLPADKFKTAVDYEALSALGAMMGAGGMVVMDQDNCMVDTARYFTGFTAAESCGKCAPCREGLSQMKHLLDRIVRGEGQEQDLLLLEELANYVKETALCGLGQTAANPVLTTLRYFRGEYEQHVRDKRCQAGVCENLYLALCENSCPVHMNIPGYLALLREDRIEEAFELALRENPLPGTLGRICHFHCQTRCRRDTVDQPVAQGEIHRYLADAVYKLGREKAIYRKLAAEKKPATGKKVSIVGAGPAGLTAAFYLVRLGHEVTIYEAHGEAGGVLRWGIPAYRLPKNVLAKEVDLIRSLGVRFVYNTRVGIDVDLQSLKDNSDAVLICLGAGIDRRLDIPGENLAGVFEGYSFLESLNEKMPNHAGQRVLVIGGGNCAVDAARSMARTGARVTVVYRRSKEEMPANANELQDAEEEGILFHAMMAPVEILGESQVHGVQFLKMKGGRMDESGRRIPVSTGETVEIEADAVIVAVGERVDADFFHKAGLATDRSGVATVDSGLRTSDPKIWVAGDAVSGPATASEAMGLAQRAARSVDAFLTGQDRFASLFPHVDYAMEAPRPIVKVQPNQPRRLSPRERKGNFQEITLGFTGEQAFWEASRCLRCDVKCAPESVYAEDGVHHGVS